MVTSIEYNHKTVESARKGQEVCIKIEPIPGEAAKMFGRHFEAKDFLVSKVSTGLLSIHICFKYKTQLRVYDRRLKVYFFESAVSSPIVKRNV